MSKFSIDKWDCKVVEKRKTWFIISASIILIGAIVIAIFGFNVGIDFSGGTLMNVTIGDYMSDEAYNAVNNDIKTVLGNNGIKIEVTQQLTSDTAPGVSVRYQNVANGVSLDEEAMHTLNQKVRDEIETTVKATLRTFKPNSSEAFLDSNLSISISNVGATASSELLLNAFISLAVAAGLILLYVALRFEFLSGLSAIVALLHDILIMCAFVAIFRIQINAPFVAALITIVGYSINNTIILFDRVRENKSKYTMRGESATVIVNTSIKETMTRSINTSITTMFTIVLLAILGVSQIREFALPILIGLLAGTYSSIFIAPPLYVVFTEAKSKKKGNTVKTAAAK